MTILKIFGIISLVVSIMIISLVAAFCLTRFFDKLDELTDDENL